MFSFLKVWERNNVMKILLVKGIILQKLANNPPFWRFSFRVGGNWQGKMEEHSPGKSYQGYHGLHRSWRNMLAGTSRWETSLAGRNKELFETGIRFWKEY